SADMRLDINTSVDAKKLEAVGLTASEIPAGFNLHPKLVKLVESRKNMALGKDPVDWGMAELLVYGSLLSEGTSIRLTGQDCVRGTFSHRHSAFYDTKTGDALFPLKKLNSENTNLCIYDSILSEYAVMGFEYGNSITDPSFLTMWEAQFGDFGNGAQIMIDQFIAAGEAKWQQMSGLVLLLPHGFEGQGPEHSSARLERFLQLSAQNNLTVVNLTTPSQIFHALRRQVKRDFRKPLIVMSPKSLLRHPRATNMIKEIAEGSFQEVLTDTLISDRSKVEKIVLVSGKLYYELLEEREKLKDSKTALVRLEQIAPFPEWKLKPILESFKNAKKIIWAQEEPQNMGAFNYVYFKISEILSQAKSPMQLSYVGRPDRASPATGSIYRHKAEQTEIIEKVFTI
ncbi:MAG: 2-oxoglutarate dehydrogenase subunit E1, partial [Moraxellaceae bacterium]|nr:2-oxoglutarate dehydrogenase subunit E1 [Pseudobdellovibrionaceae bacterium]